MALIVDDLLELPVNIGTIIFTSVAQTAYKAAWAEYQRMLNRALLIAKHDRETGKLAEEEYRKTEAYVFRELRVAKRALSEAK